VSARRVARWSTIAAAAALATALAGPAVTDAAGGPTPVNIQFQAFAPSKVDVLPGATVQWTNQSERTHTVTADDGSFDSGDVAGGGRYSRRFGTVGAFAYHCRIHPDMTGEIDVRHVILDALPTAAVPAGDEVELSGRTADPGPITVEESSGPTGPFRAVDRAVPGADGRWTAHATPSATSYYRARSALNASETRRLLVTDRRVLVRARRGHISVDVEPSDPGAHVRLQLHLRERFGWWPSAERRLDYLSRATFVVRRRVRARVVLVDSDGWTPVATSRVLRIAPPKHFDQPGT
jgi:plastocyanin